jgi:hypothetical protein
MRWHILAAVHHHVFKSQAEFGDLTSALVKDLAVPEQRRVNKTLLPRSGKMLASHRNCSKLKALSIYLL